MTTISSSDILCASASFGGKTIVEFTSSGFNSLNDVLRAIRYAAGNIVGLIHLSILNTTRGWRQCRSLFITPQGPGVQLSLF